MTTAVEAARSPLQDTLHVLAAVLGGSLPLDQLSPAAWESVGTIALDQGLAPMLLYLALEQGLRAEHLPMSLWARLDEKKRTTAVRALLFDHTQEAVDRALTARHISAVWLKGIALAHSVYPHPALRPMSDIDLLVMPERSQEAFAAILRLGFRHASEELSTGLFSKGYTLRDSRRRIEIDLHYRLFEYSGFLPEAQMGWLWARTERDHKGRLILTPEAHLLYLCSHRMLHDGGTPRLLHYFDLHLLITRRTLDWPWLIDQSAALGWAGVTAAMLNACRDLFGTPVPPDVLSRLEKVSAHETQAATLSQSTDAGRFQMFWDMFRHSTPRRRVEVLARHLLPPPRFIRARYGLWRRPWLIPAGYVYRWLELGVRTVRGLVGRKKPL